MDYIDRDKLNEFIEKRGAGLGITVANCCNFKDIVKMLPIYAKNSRGGCWFCPNSKIKEMADLKQNHIELWQELERLNQVKDKVSIYFMRNKTFEQVNAEVDAYIQRQQMQIKLPIGE